MEAIVTIKISLPVDSVEETIQDQVLIEHTITEALLHAGYGDAECTLEIV